MRFALFVLIGIASALLLLWVFQRSFIYFPTDELSVSADDFGFHQVTLTTDDGLQLSAWYHPPPDQPAVTIIVFNGNAGNRSHRTPLGRALVDRGYGVLLVDYRGYGGNPGGVSEDGLAADARAARAFVVDQGKTELVYFGESLGSAVALRLSVDHRPDALILRSPFTSLAAVGTIHYPFLPVSLLLRDRFANDDAIGDLGAPLLVIAGSDDRIVPASQSRRLWESAPEPKRLLVIEGAGHNDPALLTGREMLDQIDVFLRETVGR